MLALNKNCAFSFEKIAYFFMFSGIVGDQITTRLGIVQMGIYEANPVVDWLLSNNLWFFVDLLLFIIIISLTKLSIKYLDNKYKGSIVLSPLIIGIVRLITMINNTYILLTY